MRPSPISRVCPVYPVLSYLPPLTTLDTTLPYGDSLLSSCIVPVAVVVTIGVPSISVVVKNGSAVVLVPVAMSREPIVRVPRSRVIRDDDVLVDSYMCTFFLHHTPTPYPQQNNHQ
jgi:hypothetical protein